MRKAAAHLNNYVRYMATRDGAEKLTSGKAGLPATKNQQVMVECLLRDFPLSRGMFEYEDYQAHPTRGNASEFINRALEDNLDQIAKRENYMDYIAQRPRAQRLGVHGLFTADDKPLVLSRIADEVAHHPGNVWLPIISLRREDAARLGYDSAQRWRTLLCVHAPEIAKAMKIPWEQFRWYAAFHDEGHHPHVHMVCYSVDGRFGFLSKEGIAAIKSDLVKDIFQQELTELYQGQTRRRDELTAQARETMGQLIAQMETGTLDNPRVEELISHLSRQLRTAKGKKVYGYLKPELKALVDEIVDELAKDPRVAQAYDLWYALREDVLRSYKDDLPPRLPLSRQKEFKAIKNMVIREALRLGQMELRSEQIPDPPLPDAPAPEATRLVSPYAQYQLAKLILEDGGASPEEVTRAAAWLTQSAEAGLDCAQYALGKLYRDGRGVEKDVLQAVIWFSAAAEQDNSYAAYALGKLYLASEDAPQNVEAALRWFRRSAELGNQYARWLLDHWDEFRGPTPFQCAARLLHHLSRVFQEQMPRPALRVEVDQKLRRRIREKKIAMGHKADDHEEQTKYNQTM